MAAENDGEIRASDYMRNIAIAAAIVLGCFLIYKFHPRSTFAADGMSPRWDATVEQSRATQKPALVLFTADWCPSCAALDANVLSRPEIVNEISQHYVMIAVDLTSQGPTSVARARKYGVSGIPTLIRFDADGKETGRAHYMTPEKMMQWLHDGEASN